MGKPTMGSYSVTWQAGYLGGIALVRIGIAKADAIGAGNFSLKQAFKDLIGKEQQLAPETIQIIKYSRKRGNSDFGIGTPQSWQDR